MRKTSRILLLVGSIIAFVLAGAFLITSITSMVFMILTASGVFDQALQEAAARGNVQPADVEAAKAVLLATTITLFVVFLVVTVLELLAAIFALKARKVHERKAYIFAIVFTVIGEAYVALAGSIVGLICYNKEKNRAAKQKSE